MTYYDILGIPFDATSEQIKKAYREQIRFFHPDIFDGSEDVARIKTQQLNEAYEVLKDFESRRSYDAYLKRNGLYNRYNEKNKKSSDQKPDQESEPEPEPEPKHETERDQEQNQESSVDPELVAEELRKREEKSNRLVRNIAVIIAILVAIFFINTNAKDREAKLEKQLEEAWDEGYQEGYDNGYEIGRDEGYHDGCADAVEVATYAFKLEYEGVFTDLDMGLYHKAECMLVPETAELVFEEEAIEIGLEPCHFCVKQSNYDLGYNQGYAAGWAARAAGEDNYNPTP